MAASKRRKGSAQDRAVASLYGNEASNAANAITNKFLGGEAPLGRVSTTVPGGAETLQRYSNLANQYGTRDPVQTDVMNQMHAGLGGYTSPEYQAQREQMQRGLDSNLNTNVAQLARSQARGKVYGAAASAQQANAINAAGQTKSQLDQDLYVKNIDEKQNRLNAYGQYGQGLTQAEYGRQTGINNDRTTQENNLGAAELDREKTNLGQANAETASRINLYTGTLGQGLNKAQTKAAQQIQKEGIRRMR